jgi:acyl carrier protein
VPPSLNDLVAEELRDKPANILDSTGRQTHRRWDSFAHVQLMVAVEDRYSVKLSNAEIESIETVGQLRALLRDKGVVA